MKLIMESWRSFVKEQQESPMPEMGANLKSLPALLTRNKDKVCGAENKKKLLGLIDQIGDEEVDINNLLKSNGLETDEFYDVVKDLVAVVQIMPQGEVKSGMELALNAVCTGNEEDILDTPGVDQEEENQ